MAGMRDCTQKNGLIVCKAVITLNRWESHHNSPAKQAHPADASLS
jgi:hypothetical protein